MATNKMAMRTFGHGVMAFSEGMIHYASITKTALSADSSPAIPRFSPRFKAPVRFSVHTSPPAMDINERDPSKSPVFATIGTKRNAESAAT
jgi:hypothetical protein